MEIVVNRCNKQRTAFLAWVMVVGTFGAVGQTLPLRDPSVALTPLAPLSATDPLVRDGLFSIDLVASDLPTADVAAANVAGNAVSDLAPGDFTLLDNGQPARIRTLHNSLAAQEPAPELIFVLDAVHLSSQQLSQTEHAIAHFLRRNSGRMDSPCFVYRFTRQGLYSFTESSELTRDGNRLAQEVEQHQFPRTMWTSGRKDLSDLLNAEAGSEPIRLSLRALGSIAIDQRDIRRRKVVLWIGPGWPVDGGYLGFDEATELSTRLREARITLDNLNAWPGPGWSFHNLDYLEAPRSQKEMQPARLALQAMATQTGGLVLGSSGDLDGDIERCVEAERSYYTLTFNPPHTDRMDEFHDIRVQVARRGVTVRATTGYYNEPVYFDSPRPGIEKVTVAQLEDLVHAQTDLSRKLANLELTERLSTPRLDALLSVIHGERERQALTADADLSLALEPPDDEIRSRPMPAVEEQRAILERTFDHLRNAIPKLPDFYALRNTVRFEEPAEKNDEIWKLRHKDQTLHFASEEHATVLYRNENEVVEKKQKLGKRSVSGARARTLETRGTFGPILTYVLTAAATKPSTLSWKRWERGKEGDLAVFSYRVASKNYVPELSYCCLPEGDGTTLYQNKADTYGEFAVNPDTGAILRIAITADLDEEREPDVPLIRSQIVVEYGPEEVAGKTYICPQRSVEISRGRSQRKLPEWGTVFSLYGYFETMINDVTFGGYHKFGSEARILPGFEEAEGIKTPAPPAEPSTVGMVTVAELMKIVDAAKGKSDGNAAKEIEQLQLTERLSSARLATLIAELPGKKSKAALMAVGDMSVFLDPPLDEAPQDGAPDAAEQTRMIARAEDYLKTIIPKLPNFYASRFTTSFEEVWKPKDKEGMPKRIAVHPAGEFKATVYYREGKEVVQGDGKQWHGLVTRGTFGPILNVVVLEAANSHSIQWNRWEKGPNGAMAVFRFEVPQTESHYQVAGSAEFGMVGTTAYHGEIGIDANSGTILRLVLEADPGLDSTIERAGIMVEYGPVEIGGKTYTCPLRSVSYSVGAVDAVSTLNARNGGTRKAARLNDVSFRDYHVFLAQMRILTD